MDIAIIASTKDLASMNIKANLLEHFNNAYEIYESEDVFYSGNAKLYTINNELITYENIDKRINADFFIFISKHKSQVEKPTLSVHSIGNWNGNEFGGISNKLVLTSSLMLRKFFLILNELGKDSGYEIVYEATHHGPYLEKPAFFIEIGSTEKEWADKNAGKIIAQTIIQGIPKENDDAKTVIGIGGLHTCPEFNKAVLRNNIALSHICPKYALEFLTKESLQEAISKTAEKIDFVLLDWKGLRAEKQKILSLLNETNLDYKKTTDL
ncbi:MAG: D-aminoacyl-tRNA deacylase [Nanoarchaeota archaeon]